jgi:hypothetical protein
MVLALWSKNACVRASIAKEQVSLRAGHLTRRRATQCQAAPGYQCAISFTLVPNSTASVLVMPNQLAFGIPPTGAASGTICRMIGYRLRLALQRWPQKQLARLGVAYRIVAVLLLALLPASGCSQKCGACSLPRAACYGELADAATCLGQNGACALVEKCMCAAQGCPGVDKSGCAASDKTSCNAMTGCAWVSVCNFVYNCSQFDNMNSCNAQSACGWNPSDGCD